MQAFWMRLLANCCSSTSGSTQCIAFSRIFGCMLHVGMYFGHKNKVNKGSGTSYGSVKHAESIPATSTPQVAEATQGHARRRRGHSPID